ncbi:hypothetical protein [Pseudoalteromonas sp. Of7M-16]|uniref:hypothetical protein n=1 Tax=Pseudoalteromonas sp. Of7M-16 TaxID=2917756 RepID=UPI001EF5E59F|nr:hypothetical protein [Pseudoalteromonas sp. Of7M-16]MCG7550973.1 hypothetical protein [Pseudoalteromonas sp. Of7M-16]
MINEIKRIVSPALHAPADQKTKVNLAYTLLHQQYFEADIKQGKHKSSTVEDLHYWLECFGYVVVFNGTKAVTVCKKTPEFDAPYKDIEHVTVKPMTPSALAFYLNQLPI